MLAPTIRREVKTRARVNIWLSESSLSRKKTSARVGRFSASIVNLLS
jgi:hypothetical protein